MLNFSSDLQKTQYKMLKQHLSTNRKHHFGYAMVIIQNYDPYHLLENMCARWY